LQFALGKQRVFGLDFGRDQLLASAMICFLFASRLLRHP